MAVNKVLYNISQDATSGEKQTARNNIGAAAKVQVSNPMSTYSGDMSIEYISDVGLNLVKVDNSPLGFTLTNPGTSGVYLTTDSGGHVVWDVKDSNNIQFNSYYHIAESGNTIQLTNYSIQDEAAPNWTEVIGTITFVPSVSGKYSICPYTSDNRLIGGMGSQISSVTCAAGVTNSVPFYFKWSSGDFPYKIGIKGGQQASITVNQIITQKK